MKVIFLTDVKNVAKRHDVKDVADGYARNFLLPNKLAQQATPAAIRELATIRERTAKEKHELEKRVEELKRKIGGQALEFYLKTDESGSIFGSVNKETILSALRDSGLITKERVEIKPERPIKELGEHKITVRFKSGDEAELKIIVRPQE